jgi:hypothetical protein
MFREIFITRFGGEETATSTLMKILREPLMKDENVAAYGIRIRSLLKTKLQHATMDEMFNAIALCHISPHDQRIEEISLENDIKTES